MKEESKTDRTEERVSASYASGCSEKPLLGETIGENLARIAKLHPGRDALIDVAQGRRWTYAQFDAQVSELARAMLAAGIARGERVGIWAPNCPEWVLLQYATARIGAILVCINPAYRVHELAFVLKHAGVSMLFSALRNRGADYRAMVSDARSSAPTLRDVIYVGDESWDAFIRGAVAVTAESLEIVAGGLSFDDPVNIQYTSGTTGAPKGATLTHHNILNNGYFVGEMIGYTEADRVCVPVPFYHCFGMVMGNLGATTHGAAIVIPSANFDPAATVRAIAQERCTSLYGVPTMFIGILETRECAELDLSSLRTGIMAGAPCPITVMREVMDRLHMREIAISYGMTETSPVSTMTRRDDDLRRRTETVGSVMPHVQIQIVDPSTGRIVPRGVAGEVCTRGYSVMRSYWEEPDKTREAIDSGGWMHTGDLGVMSGDGYVSIVGRIKDMVIRGGENIYPREIEEFLLSHPDIAEVHAVGVPDPKYGEEVMACIRMRDGTAPLSAEALKDFCAGRIARHKIPRHVRHVTSFPMTVTGKVRKVELRAQAIEWMSRADSVVEK